MRRGHPGSGGWRNENQRHFRPRSSGSQRFRPPRSFSLLETLRFPPPIPGLHRGPHPYNNHGVHTEDHRPIDHQERNNYRNQFHLQNNPRLQDRGHQQRSRSLYSYPPPNTNKDDNTQSSSYKHSPNFYNDVQVESFQVNSLGDIDHRQLGSVSHNTYGNQRISPWVNLQHDQRHFYEDRSPQKYYRHHDSERQAIEGNRIPTSDYTGHRPPSSDHYGSTSSTTITNNNTSFSRSVDDTVDIVRKRLMNRNDPQRLSQDVSAEQNNSEQEVRENINQHTPQDQPTKKRIQRQKNAKSNCDKMKTNIVHQLFKMDKDKIHKLMDDPGSSSKFEYAISSLITESQNSLNRHLRSVAEKSLESTSSDFIHNDNNTIYEDTFMKQMQCILDPQDTVLLEDIKPLVMAELSKVLQLDDFEGRFEAEDHIYHNQNDQQHYTNYENFNSDGNYENFNQERQERFYDVDDRIPPEYGNSIRTVVAEHSAPNFDCGNQEVKTEDNYFTPEPLFERRSLKISDENRDRRRKSDENRDRRLSIENQRQRRSIDKTIEDIYNINDEPVPLFDTNTEQFSEEEDTFAELDKQYHVAVDHNFIDDVSARTTPNLVQPSEINTPNIKKEIDSQLQSFAQSPLKLLLSEHKLDVDDRETNIANVKQEILQSPDFPKENSTPANSDNIAYRIEHVNIKQEYASKCKERETNNANITKTSQSNSRKRSVDQRPAHRKEKRKKSESSSSDATRSSYHRHDHSDTYNTHSKSEEKYSSAPKPYYSIFTQKDDSSKEAKDNKRRDTVEKDYSDKYVRRKRSSKSKDRETHKKRTSSSSSQTNILSPKDSCSSSVTPKCDSKTKLKTIDMFVEQPKKVSVHQSHRNTAPTAATTTPKAVEENKNKQVTTPTRKTVQTKHASTQVIKRVISKETQTFESKSVTSRYSQTEKPKRVSKGFQTPRTFTEKSKPKAREPFERMKEIDMEIQALLQEKFKLYNNLESKDACPSSVKLGMTVLNVTTPMEDENENDVQEIDADDNDNVKTECDTAHETTSNPDTIVDDFTSIPVEELEQIALESVEDVNFDENKLETRNSRHKTLQQERTTSESPQSTSSRKSNKRRKTPNISLIEQIITDDRPLEDIISLDDLEGPPPKHKKKRPRSKPKKKVSKKSKAVKSNDIETYDLKECSVILIQTDISKFINTAPALPTVQTDEVTIKVEDYNILEELPESIKICEHPKETESYNHSEPNEVVEESVVNDLQFDMLDVSEDIVIGESCEIKDKDSSGQSITISEEVILDNSQSSMEDVFTAESSQAENECKTYDYSTDEELRRDSLTVTGNVDAVLAIECIENNFIAACLDGNVYHFSGDGQLLNTMRGSNLAVTCLTIVKEKYGTTVYTGSLDSRIRYYDLDTGLEKGPECNVLSPIQTMDRAWDTVFVGTRTGFVLQFECKNNMLIPVSTVKFSEQAILALRAMKEGARKVLLVASRSENVTIKDAQTGLLLRTLAGPKMTVYTLLFEDGKVYCGTSSHQIHVFDYSSGTHTGCHEGGKGAVCLRATGGLLFAGCYDGCVYVYREGETRPRAQLRGPSLMLLSLAVLGSKIIAGYKDRSLYIWKIPLSILQEMIL